MKIKMLSLVSEIRKGLWAIDVSNLGAYIPFVNNLIAGNEVKFTGEVKAASLLEVLDDSGNARRPNSQGVVDVPANSIAQVTMQGEIIKSGDMCVYGADDIVEALDAANNNPNIDSIVFNIDGPGGAVAAIDVFRDFKARKKKPIVGLLGDALSLHYWTAVELCDFLISDGDVSPRFGSVGVVFSAVDASKAMEEKGLVKIEVYAPESEHKNLAFINALKGDFKMLQDEYLSPLAVMFQGSVRGGRPNLKEEEGVLSGKTFYAREALRLGMIDAIGNKQMAIAKAKGLALAKSVSSIK